MLGRVGEGLGDDVVDRCFDRCGQSFVRDAVDLDLERGAGRDRLERGCEAAFGEDRWVESARELAELFERELEMPPRGVAP